jgi:hypothetical protein
MTLPQILDGPNDPPKMVLQMEDPSKNRGTLLQEAVRASSPWYYFSRVWRVPEWLSLIG